MVEFFMHIFQKKFRLRTRRRGFHLIDDEVRAALPEIGRIRAGTLQLFLQHTSASLCLGENADPTVRGDLERFFSDIADDKPYYRHTYEGPDDMPAHIKSIMIGVSLTLPITDGRLALGTWQGIYLNEHRDDAAGRTLIATMMGR